MFGKKGRELVSRDEAHAVIGVHMARAGNDEKVLRFSRQLVGLFAFSCPLLYFAFTS